MPPVNITWSVENAADSGGKNLQSVTRVNFPPIQKMNSTYWRGFK
ncbi:hypothetical protein P10159_0280 [Citrobacter portucalensis]|nr:hypothetical protein P10159_0280 [Citrobacter portucalensis]